MEIINRILAQISRESVAMLPTPFQRLNSLSEILKRNLYVKRDDMTGFAFGGNKARKLDFLIADALKKGCDSIIGMGYNQSNFCRILAGAGAKFGMSVHLVLNGSEPKNPTGNLLLDHLLGATIYHIETTDPEEHLKKTLEVKNSLEYDGKQVYLLPPGGSTTIGALGYVAGWGEIMDDISQNEVAINKIIVASSTAGTQAGLVVGQAISGWQGEIIGISVDLPQVKLETNVHDLARAVGNFLNINVPKSLIKVDDHYRGAGYGKRTALATEAIDLFARKEGIFLDHVYTGKAASALIDYCRIDQIKSDDSVLFIHTGGNVELFA
jgi:D-cysteine desulfhydrase family pyridoxal phosphate-dependent enzyme